MICLTIAVPAYNSAATLEKCLNSFLEEKFRGRLEVVVVNDGSTDDTESIARAYQARRPEVFRLICQENGGHGSAVNAGLAAATGKYFRIVDADDWVNPAGLEALLQAMEGKDPDCFLDQRTEVHGLTEAGTPVRLPEGAPVDRVIPFEEIAAPEYARCISMHTLTCRTSLLREKGIRLMEHTFYVDMQYVIGVTAFVRTAYLLPREVYFYRLGCDGQSVSYLNYVKNYRQHDKVLKTCADFCENRAGEMPEGRREYMRFMLTLLARTQFNIALIYNPDRRQGAEQARELDHYLAREWPWLARATRSRRWAAGILHSLGVGYHQLQRIKAAAGRA